MKNCKTLIIVESPGKINSIQKYVGDNYIVLASGGHIVNLAKGGRFGIGVNPFKKFKTYYSIIPEKLPFLDKIISSSDKYDKIIICSDPDLEGHGIAWHLGQNLSHLNKPIFRAEFHEITKKGIEDGLKNLKPLSIESFNAQEARRVLDRLVGFMVSPYLITHYGSNLSAGRVQSVTARMVIEREEEIKSFEPKEYWNISVKLTNEKEHFVAKLLQEIDSKSSALKIEAQLKQNASDFKVSSVKKTVKKEEPYPPLNTAKMQQIMASKFDMDGDRTMQAAQALYELGYCTYIRTDSVRISDSALEPVRTWLSLNKFDIPGKPNFFKNKSAAQDAHECIRPTNVNLTPDKLQLSDIDTIRLYKIIWMYFVCSQMLPAVYALTEVKINHMPSKLLFKINGKILQSLGFLSLDKENIKNDNYIPIFSVGDKLKLFDNKSIILEQKFTQPPPRYNYSSLIKELEKKNIGRPSTYNTIVSTISNRQYVVKNGNSFSGTSLGLKINSVLKDNFDFLDYDYTSKLEDELDKIAEGKLDKVDVLNSFYTSLKDKLGKAHAKCGGKLCQKCGFPIYKKVSKANIEFFSCGLYPFCL